MTVFDLTWKQFLWVMGISICIITIKVWFFPEQPKKETRIQKSVRILDKKWDKWIERNE